MNWYKIVEFILAFIVGATIRELINKTKGGNK
jgi:hypothetical protein